MRRSKLKLGSAAFAVAGRLMKIEERGGEEEEVLMRRARWMVFVLLALSFILMPMEGAWAQIFPVPPNVAVATCQARSTPVGARFVVGVVDIRDPICNAPPFAVDLNTGSINNWLAPMYHNAMPNPTNNAADEWTAANLGGEVYGIALDNDPDPNIYVTATSSYFGGHLKLRRCREDGRHRRRSPRPG